MTKLNILWPSTDANRINAMKKALNAGTDSRGSRRVFDTYEAARAAFDAIAKEADGAIPMLDVSEVERNAHAFEPETITWTDEDGDHSVELTPAAVIGFIGQQRKKPGEEDGETGIMAVALFPLPSVEAFIYGARPWVEKIIEKEIGLVAFRRLRQAESLEELMAAVEQQPVLVGEYTAAHAREGGVDLSTLKTIWSGWRSWLKEQAAPLAAALPTRAQVVKALRSKSYALADPETVEIEKAGLWEMIGKSLIHIANSWEDKEGNSDPQDAAMFEEWLTGRDTLALEYRTAEKDYSKLGGISLSFASDDEGEE